MKKRLMINNLMSKVVALVLAILLWFFVTIEVDVSNFTITREVPVTLMNLSTDLVAMNEEDFSVTVKLTGRKSALQSIQTSDITVRADMNNRSEGTHQVPVIVTVPEVATLTSVTPATIEIDLEAMISTNFKIDVVLEGALPEGFAASERVKTVPTDVMIRGPRSIINEIRTVEAYVDISEAEGTFTSTVPLLLFDHNGTQIISDKLTLQPEITSVTVSVGEIITLPIEAVLSGTPQTNYVIDTVTVTPELVEVIKVQNTAEDIDVISTFDIDVEGLDGSLEKTIGLNVPEGYELIDRDLQYVTVRIEAQRVIEEKYEMDTARIQFDNGDASLQYGAIDDTFEVTFRGRESVLNALNLATIPVSVDVAGIENEGTYTLPLIMEVPEDIEIIGGTPMIIIEVKRV